MAQNMFLKAKQAGSTTAKALRVGALAVASAAAVTLPAAAAAAAQPDVGEVVTYVLAGIATIALVCNASLMVKAAVAVFSWVRGSIR